MTDKIDQLPKILVAYLEEPLPIVPRCNMCNWFIPEEGACRLVEGDISPDAWCVLWFYFPFLK